MNLGEGECDAIAVKFSLTYQGLQGHGGLGQTFPVWNLWA
jgi:hypothetical protein